MFGKMLKEARKSYFKTQKQFAKIVNVPLGTYKSWEAGITYPNNENMIKLGEILEPEIYNKMHSVWIKR